MPANWQSRIGSNPAAHYHRFYGSSDRYCIVWRMAGNNWLVAFITLLATVLFSVFLQNKGLLGMLPILLGAIFGYIVSAALGIVNYGEILTAEWLRVPACREG